MSLLLEVGSKLRHVVVLEREVLWLEIVSGEYIDTVVAHRLVVEGLPHAVSECKV